MGQLEDRSLEHLYQAGSESLSAPMEPLLRTTAVSQEKCSPTRLAKSLILVGIPLSNQPASPILLCQSHTPSSKLAGSPWTTKITSQISRSLAAPCDRKPARVSFCLQAQKAKV